MMDIQGNMAEKFQGLYANSKQNKSFMKSSILLDFRLHKPNT